MTDAPAIKQNSNGIWMLEGEQLWDSDLLPIILEHINEGDTVIDAGAWIGGHTMAYAKKVGEGGKVFAFEPNPYAYDCLENNTKHFVHVLISPSAVGDKNGYVPFSMKKGWYDSGYVGGDKKSEAVYMSSLDYYELAPNFIKIDVEGCELKVLKGAAKTIGKHRPIMVIEVNEPALRRQGDVPLGIYSWLGSRNYAADTIGDASNNDIYNILVTPR